MEEPEKKPGIVDDEIHLLDYLIVIAKHSPKIIFTSIVMATLTYLIMSIFPNEYTATARLLPLQQNITLRLQVLDRVGSTPLESGNIGSSGSSIADLLGLKFPGEAYVSILTGNTIFNRMIKRFDLAKYYSSFLSFGSPNMDDLRKKLGEMSNISFGNGLITVKVTDKNPKLAAAMANAFGEELDRLLRQIYYKGAEKNLVFLEKQRAQTGINLAKAEEALKHFNEKGNVLQIDAQARVRLRYIASLRASIDAKEVEVEVLRRRANPANLTNYDLDRLGLEIRGLKDKLKEAETQLDPNSVGDEWLVTNKVPELGLEYLRLYREVKYQETVYGLYCRLAELARLNAARNVVTVRFVDRATPPVIKSGPKRLKPSLLVGFVTFSFMIVLAFIEEGWQRAAAQEDQAERLEKLRFYLQWWLQAYRSVLAKVRRR
jgi:tyrosine-protein kinase Etk/Wzc